MGSATYTCKIIGDGKSTETAFRPAIADVKDSKGNPAFPAWVLAAELSCGPDGKPALAQIDVVVKDNSNAALVASNPDVTVKADPAPASDPAPVA